MIDRNTIKDRRADCGGSCRIDSKRLMGASKNPAKRHPRRPVAGGIGNQINRDRRRLTVAARIHIPSLERHSINAAG